MCVGLPAKVLRVSGEVAYVDPGHGRERMASLAAGEEVRPGDYVLLYADLIVSKLSRREAQKTMRLMRELAARGMEEDGQRVPPPGYDGSLPVARPSRRSRQPIV